jgi:hypothetical protein
MSFQNIEIMLQDKIKQKLFSTNELFDKMQKDDCTAEKVLNFSRPFEIKTICTLCGLQIIKKKGYEITQLLRVLLIMPFVGTMNVWNMMQSGYSFLTDAQKDAFYRLKNNPEIDWRKILYAFCKRFIALTKAKGNVIGNGIKCLIIDDSSFHKSGVKTENMGKVWDHVLGKSILGMKFLACVFWDGVSLIPLDFTLHREKGKNKKMPFGIKKRKLQKQYKKERERLTAGAKRDKECDKSKITTAIQMIKRAVKHGFVPDYVLCDSWLFCFELLQAVKALKNGSIHLLAMCKMGKINFEWMGKEYSAGQLLKHLAGKKKRCRKVNSYYIECIVTCQGIDLKLFFSRFSKRDKWRLLVTTDTSLSYIKAIEIYQIRWSIEVMFKELKQYLQIEKCQSLDFDAQIADTTLRLIQYLILTFKKRFECYETLGGVFRHSQELLQEMVLAERLWLLFLEIVKEIGEILEIDVTELIEKIIWCEKTENLISQFLMLNSPGNKAA